MRLGRVRLYFASPCLELTLGWVDYLNSHGSYKTGSHPEAVSFLVLLGNLSLLSVTYGAREAGHGRA